ncbi:MAG: response regulator [Desulfarculaceae bacterium]|nr:response regulator [Desulfarculaceae bacterium]
MVLPCYQILLIEDNPGDALLIREYLKEAPDFTVEIQQAGTLDEGLSLLCERSYDLILLDLGLPDSNGLSTFKSLKSSAVKMPIIVLTGLDDIDVASESLRRGGQDYIWKNDLNPRSLAMAVRFSIERFEAQEERSQIEEKLLQVQKLESLGVMAGGIAHDFNNILMAVLGNAELARGELALEAPARPYLEQIEIAAKRLADLTNQLLAYSGKGRFQIKPINFSTLVGELAELLKTVVSKRARVRMDLAPDLPLVKADVTQLRQVIMNLITNASDALKDENGNITIITGHMEADEAYLSQLSLKNEIPAGTYVFLEISDDGCGMDAATQARIFDPFFTTKFTGRGLGLAAVAGIISGHCGTIKIYSEVGKGSCIKILLPTCDEPAEESRSVFSKLSVSRDKTVLVVDDDDLVRGVTRLALEKFGCRVLSAKDGVEGVELYKQHQEDIDLIILDMTMPRMDGVEAFRQLRKLNPQVKVILSSGYNEQDATNRFVGKGLAGFIQKPFTPSALREKLDIIFGEDPTEGAKEI